MSDRAVRTRSVLDTPSWSSLTGGHAHLARGGDRARAYPADVSPFAGLADPADPEQWTELSELVGRGAELVVPVVGAVDAPAGWTVVSRMVGVQLVAGPDLPAPPPGGTAVLVLGPDDVPDMVDLADRTRPGPFVAGTAGLGRFRGVRSGGRLLAMAGERFRPPGWTEVSAVCTDPAARGRGLAGRLVLAVASGVLERGDRPFLHVLGSNTGALRLYRSLGFTDRCEVVFLRLRSPGWDGGAPGTGSA